MKKKIYSYEVYKKKILAWQKKLGSNKLVKKLANKLYIEADKNNYSYLHSWNGEPLLQTPEDLFIIEEIINKTVGFSRLQAAKYFAARKQLDLKTFLILYSVITIV